MEEPAVAESKREARRPADWVRHRIHPLQAKRKLHRDGYGKLRSIPRRARSPCSASPVRTRLRPGGEPRFAAESNRGSILQTISRTLHEEVKFDRSRVTSVDWASYPILRFPEAPIVTVALISSSGNADARRGGGVMRTRRGRARECRLRRHRRPAPRGPVHAGKSEGGARQGCPGQSVPGIKPKCAAKSTPVDILDGRSRPSNGSDPRIIETCPRTLLRRKTHHPKKPRPRNPERVLAAGRRHHGKQIRLGHHARCLGFAGGVRRSA